MLMLLERVAVYFKHHPNVMKHIAGNCTLFDDEKIEFLNAKVTPTRVMLIVSRALI